MTPICWQYKCKSLYITVLVCVCVCEIFADWCAEFPSCVSQPSLQLRRPSSPAWMKPPWCWSGCLHEIQEAVKTSFSTSSARAAAAAGEAAPAAGTTFSLCPASWAWQSPGSTLATCWPTRNTRLRCRLSTECQIRAPTLLSTPRSTLPLTRLVSGPICLFPHSIFPMWFPLLSSSLSCLLPSFLLLSSFFLLISSLLFYFLLSSSLLFYFHLFLSHLFSSPVISSLLFLSFLFIISSLLCSSNLISCLLFSSHLISSVLL